MNNYNNCMVDSKENYKFDLEVKGLKEGKVSNEESLNTTQMFISFSLT